jgi:signal transduction histidine kinase
VRQFVVRVTAAAVAAGVVGVSAAALAVHVVDERAELRARTETELAAVVTAAEVTAEREALLRAVARTSGGREGRIGVQVGGEAVGRVPPPDADPATVLARTVPGDPPRTVTAVVPPWRPGRSTGALLAVLAAGGVLCVLAAALLAGRRARPIAADVAAAADAIDALAAGRSAAAAATVGRTRETANLAAALDAVGRHIDEVRTAERRLVADLSHRLRTPLTALALDADAIGDGPVADRVRRSIASLDHEVDELIRAARPQTAPAARCDAVEVVGRRMAFWAALGRHRGRHPEFTSMPPPAPIPLAPEDLAATVDALLGNVFRYTPEGTPFAVRLVRHAGWVTLVVDDGGPGIPDPAAALRRGVSGGGSTGLGLAIARDAVEATGGTIHIERAALGGTRVRLRFGEAGAAHADPHEPRAWRLWGGDAHGDLLHGDAHGDRRGGGPDGGGADQPAAQRSPSGGSREGSTR